MRLKKTKALRYVVATFLTMGTVLSVGFLSFSGLWLIYPYIIPAILAFFLSGVIEGKVFGTGIFKGLARLKLLTSSAQKHLLISELNQLIIHKMKDSNWLDRQCLFLKDYWQQKEYYKSLKKDPHINEIELQAAKERLEELKNYFYQKVSSSNFKGNDYLQENLKNAGEHLLQTAKRSVWFLRFFWIISILTGIVSGFVTAFAVQEAITVGLALSLSATALSAIVWPVAIFAAIGATFLLYYAITDIVKNDAISKACSKTLELFKQKTEESISAYSFRLLALCLGVVGIASLTVFATAASGGTCWIVMQKGIKLLAPKLPIFVAYCVSTILIPINFATDLIYGFSTTLQTIDNCKSIFIAIFEGITHPIEAIKNFWFNIKNKLVKLKEKESWGQFFNPFRIVAMLVISPLQSLVFIGHLISIGLTTDRFFNVPPPVVAGLCATSEGLQDLSFLTKEDDHSHAHGQHDHEEDDGHDHGNLLQLPLQLFLFPILLPAGIFYWVLKKFGSGVGFFEAIKNTFDLPLLNIVFFPLLLPSAIWHWTFKKSENNLTFFESIKKSFDIHTHDHSIPDQPETPKELSANWREEERVDWILSKAIKHLDGAWFDKHIAAEKQSKLKLLASHRESIINFFKAKREEIPNLSIEDAVEMYFKKNALKEKLGNGISEHLDHSANEEELNRSIKAFIENGLGKSPVENGHSKGNNNTQKPPLLYCNIFQTRRGFFSFNTSKPTTTETHVKNALSLATAA
ncbi:MAG: hypothetical protein RJA83_555 [Pseudomonadota bacterium]|jgi:hypothetical protein